MTAVVIAFAVIVAWRFARRARLGARVRALAGVRLRTTDRMARAFERVHPMRVAAAALAGYVAGGPGMAAVAGAGIVIVEPLLRARARRSERARVDEQVPDVLRAIASAMRAGRSLPGALEAAWEQAEPPVERALFLAVRRIEVGAPIDEALDAFAGAAGTDAARDAAETMRIGRTAGANLPAVLDLAVASIADRGRVERDRRAATAQARLSGAVVGAMPLAFFVLAGPAARQQMHVLLAEPVGWLLLGLGLTLEAGGALWMRALLR